MLRSAAFLLFTNSKLTRRECRVSIIRNMSRDDSATRQQSRQGRHKVAQGVSPGLDGPHPACGTPLPPERERGRG